MDNDKKKINILKYKEKDLSKISDLHFNFSSLFNKTSNSFTIRENQLNVENLENVIYEEDDEFDFDFITEEELEKLQKEKPYHEENDICHLPYNEKVNLAKEFSEGKQSLENFLLYLWQNNINTMACCAGHEGKYNKPYIMIDVATLTKNQLAYIISHLMLDNEIYEIECEKNSIWQTNVLIFRLRNHDKEFNNCLTYFQNALQNDKIKISQDTQQMLTKKDLSYLEHALQLLTKIKISQNKLDELCNISLWYTNKVERICIPGIDIKMCDVIENENLKMINKCEKNYQKPIFTYVGCFLASPKYFYALEHALKHKKLNTFKRNPTRYLDSITIKPISKNTYKNTKSVD